MNTRHLSAFDLDLLMVARAAVPPEVERHLHDCPTCEGRHGSRLIRHAEFERERLPRLLLRPTRRPAIPARRLLLGGLGLLPMVLATLFLVVRPGSWPGTGPIQEAIPSSSTGVGLKGLPGLRLFARRGETVFEVPVGATLNPGDALRFVLEPVGYPYLLIVSLDGNGNASVYFPFGGTTSIRVDSTRMVEAPDGSVILDHAQGPERVFALWSTEPLEARVVLARLRELGRQGPWAIRATTRLDIPGTLETSRLFERGILP